MYFSRATNISFLVPFTKSKVFLFLHTSLNSFLSDIFLLELSFLFFITVFYLGCPEIVLLVFLSTPNSSNIRPNLTTRKIYLEFISAVIFTYPHFYRKKVDDGIGEVRIQQITYSKSVREYCQKRTILLLRINFRLGYEDMIILICFLTTYLPYSNFFQWVKNALSTKRNCKNFSAAIVSLCKKQLLDFLYAGTIVSCFFFFSTFELFCVW